MLVSDDELAFETPPEIALSDELGQNSTALKTTPALIAKFPEATVTFAVPDGPAGPCGPLGPAGPCGTCRPSVTSGSLRASRALRTRQPLRTLGSGRACCADVAFQPLRACRPGVALRPGRPCRPSVALGSLRPGCAGRSLSSGGPGRSLRPRPVPAQPHVVFRTLVCLVEPAAVPVDTHGDRVAGTGRVGASCGSNDDESERRHPHRPCRPKAKTSHHITPK